MKAQARVGIVFIVVSIILTFVVPPAFAQNTNTERTNLQKLYMDYLTAEGYAPKIDSDGDVVFKREGRPYFINVEESDPEYFSVVRPNFWSIDSEEELMKVVLAAQYTNSRTKVCKIFTVKMNTWAAVQMFVASPEDFKGTFNRAMSAIDTGVIVFVGLMRQGPDPAPALPRIRD